MSFPQTYRIIIMCFFGIAGAGFLIFESVPMLLRPPGRNDMANLQAPSIEPVNYLRGNNVILSGAAENPVTLFDEENIPKFTEYLKVTGGCGPDFSGGCVNARSGPGEENKIVMKLRNGMVLKIDTTISVGGQTWYKVNLDEQIRYPDRIKEDLYVAGEFTEVIPYELADIKNPETSKRIVVDRGEQMLRAYDGDELFMETKISTGLALTPTPHGTFTIFKKMPSRYMQGPLPGVSDQYFDLPGVPWNLYFTSGGAVIHGAYWHNSFGRPWSHGCVNVPLEEAQKLYEWAEVGAKVVVRD